MAHHEAPVPALSAPLALDPASILAWPGPSADFVNLQLSSFPMPRQIHLFTKDKQSLSISKNILDADVVLANS